MCQHPSYRPLLSMKISPTKEIALELAQKTHHTVKYKVYCDGSSYKGRVRAAAILYKNNRILERCRFKLGTPEEHTIYKVELVGIILTLHLLIMITHQIMRPTVIGLDNQAAIHMLTNQSAKPSHYLLNIIVLAAEKQQERQDKIQNAPEFWKAKHQGSLLVARMNGVVDLQIHWVPGHKDFALDKEVDSHAKRVAKGDSSPGSSLPKSLRKPFPLAYYQCSKKRRPKFNISGYEDGRSHRDTSSPMQLKKSYPPSTCGTPLVSLSFSPPPVSNQPHRPQ